MSSFRVCPTADPNVTRMEFDYYHLESGDRFEEYYKFVRQVAMEDFELCEKAQENLQKGVYNEGILNPEKESGVACEHPEDYDPLRACSSDYTNHAVYQERVFDLVCEQYESEKLKLVETEHGPEPERELAPGVVSSVA